MKPPKGISSANFASALQEFATAVGKDWVFSSDEDVAMYRDAYSPFPGEPEKQYLASAAVAPKSVEEVQAIVRVANKYKIPIYPISTGRNLGYGGSSPTYSGSVIVDLKRMDKIIEVNSKEGYMIVEPGISFMDLFRYFKDNNIDYTLSAPQPGWGSPIGNGLERGQGIAAPFTDNFGMVKGMEVVLPTGELMRTGFGAVPTSKLWANNPYGYGPYINGMFTQSNYGIVTKMCFWLVPTWEAEQSFTVESYRTDDMQPIIEVLMDLHNRNVLDGWGVGSPIRESMSTNDGRRPFGVPAVKTLLHKADGGTKAEWDALGRANNIPVTQGRGNARGPASVVKAKIGHAQSVLGKLPVTFKAGPVTSGHDWAGPSIDFGILAVQGTNRGHFYFSPLFKPNQDDIFAINDTIRRVMTEAGDMEMLDNFGWSAGRGISFGKNMLILLEILVHDDVVVNRKRRQLYLDLVKACGENGWSEYRAPVAFQGDVINQYSFNNHALHRFHETIKDAIDPNGILAPGKAGIWPKHLRKA